MCLTFPGFSEAFSVHKDPLPSTQSAARTHQVSSTTSHEGAWYLSLPPMVAHKFHDVFACYGCDIPSFFPRRYQCLRMLPHSTDIQNHAGTWFSDFFPLGYIISCVSPHMGTNIQGCLKPKPTVKIKNQLLLSVGLALECGWYTQCHFLEENWCLSPSNYQLQTASWLGWDFVPPSLLCTGALPGSDLWRSDAVVTIL